MITLSRENYDSIYKGPRPNLSSPSWYMKETGKFHIPYTLGTWNIFGETGEFFDHSKLNNDAYPHTFYSEEIIWKDSETLEHNEKHIYLVNVFNPDFFKLNNDIGFDLMHERFKKDVIEKRCKVVIWYVFEGYSQMEGNNDIEIVENWRIKAGFPKNSVHFITGNAIASEHIKVRNNGIRVHHYEAFSAWNKNEVINPVSKFKPVDNKQLFLTYNRAPRPSRLHFIAKLQEYGILDRGRASLGKPVDAHHSNPIRQHGVYDRDWREVAKQLPLQIDNKTTFFNLACNIEIQDYESTFCSVITETLVNKGTLFVSEKIWKPIIMGHPFFVLGSVGTLQYLKCEGYKTFSKWFNEEYDQFEDWTNRSEHIAKELKKLSLLSTLELHEMRKDMQEILAHNRSHFEYKIRLNWGHGEDYEPQHCLINQLKAVNTPLL